MSDGPPIWSEGDYAPPPDYGPPPPTGKRCLSCENPATWTSPTGHHFCDECRKLYNKVVPKLEYRFEPVDLDELMASDPPAEDWHVEPIVPKRKLVGISSTPAQGKSLLLVDIACKKATGEKILDQPAESPEHVIYLDMEMGPDELYDRLTDLGYTPQHPLWRTLRDNLHYYQLIALPPLNTEEGGQALEEMIDRHAATFVVIDTLARVIVGSENDSQPYQELFRFTETMLKRRAITLVRLDHLGKDPTKGTRGASAKSDGLDVVWQMQQIVEGTMQFKRLKGRQPWVPENTTIHRIVENSTVSHTAAVEAVSQDTIDLAYQLDLIGVPIDAGTPTAQRMLKEAGKGRRRIQVRHAVRYRKTLRGNVGPPPDHTPGPPAGTSGTTPQETQQTLGEISGTTKRTTLDQSEGLVPSLRDGPPLDPDLDEENIDFDLEALLSAAGLDFEDGQGWE